MPVPSVGQETPLEGGMAAHSNILAWRIPMTEDPSGLWSTGLQSQTRLKRPNMCVRTQILPWKMRTTDVMGPFYPLWYRW